MKELLKVLDMTGDEQVKWLLGKGLLRHHPTSGKWVESLADLAIRLRDEVCKNDRTAYKYYCALKDCFGYRRESLGLSSLSFNLWLYKYIKPIDMIIAALIAKEQEQ